MFFTSVGFSITAIRFLQRNGLISSARLRTDLFDWALSSMPIAYQHLTSAFHPLGCSSCEDHQNLQARVATAVRDKRSSTPRLRHLLDERADNNVRSCLKNDL